MNDFSTPSPSSFSNGHSLMEIQDNYLRHVGPFYLRKLENGSTLIAIHAGPVHINQYGLVHGGMIATLADVAIGLNLGELGSPKVRQALTLNLSINFLGGSKLGDWIEAHVCIGKAGGRVRFANCDLKVGERIFAQAHATFYSSN